METEDDVSSTLESLESYVKQWSGHKGSQVETETVELKQVYLQSRFFVQVNKENSKRNSGILN